MPPRGRAIDGGRAAALSLGRFGERGDLAARGEVRQRLALDLADALRADAQPTPDLRHRERLLLAVEPVAKLDDLALALGQTADDAAYDVLGQLEVHELVDARRVG